MKRTLVSTLALVCAAFMAAAGFISCAQDDGESQPASGSDSENVNEKIVFKTPDLASKRTASLAGTALEGKSVTWSVEDPYVCSVENGVIVPLGGGKTTVTAKADGAQVVFSVEVSEPDRPASLDVLDAKALSGDIDIIMCGDSIMRTYGAADSDQCGLGQVMQDFFTTAVTVDNSISNGGRSSRYFYNEDGRWNKVKEKLAANKGVKPTVVFFSFGHNDQRTLDGGDSRVGEYGASWTFAETNQNGTVAGTFYDYIERYIVETRELGGIPVLLSPFVRNDFSGDSVSEKGRHNMTSPLANKSGTESKGRGNYPLAMKKAAEKHNAIFVDMTSMTAEYSAKMRAVGKSEFLYIASDNTHERTLGALKMAEMVTQKLKSDGILADYIVAPSPRIMVDKGSLAFGRLYPNISKILSFKVTSFNAVSGTIKMTAPDGYALSLSESGEFTKTLEIQCGESFVGENVFLKFTPTEVAEYNGSLEIEHTSVTPDFGNTPAGKIEGRKLLISLTGAGKEKVTGGTACSVTWPMISGSSYSDVPVVNPEGCVEAKNAKLVGLVKSTNKNDVVENKPRARVTIDTAGNKWPVNDAGVKMDGVYIEYAVPVNGGDFTVNSISCRLSSSGGSNMAWSIYYSTDAEFKNPTPICEIDCPKVKDTLKTVSTGDEELGLTLGEGETLYLRIYPAYMDTKENSGRQLMLGDITVKGLLN